MTNTVCAKRWAPARPNVILCEFCVQPVSAAAAQDAACGSCREPEVKRVMQTVGAVAPLAGSLLGGVAGAVLGNRFAQESQTGGGIGDVFGGGSQHQSSEDGGGGGTSEPEWTGRRTKSPPLVAACRSERGRVRKRATSAVGQASFSALLIAMGLVAVGCGKSTPSEPAVVDSGIVAPLDARDSSGETTVSLVLLSTTDLHARIYPFDYYSAVADETVGLAKIATLIRKERAANPCTLLIDSGDTIQGTPLGTLHATASGAIHPMAAAMNVIGYDAMALGNHEFNFGLPSLRKFIADSKFPVLAANVRKVGDGSEAFGSFVIKEVCGVRVGILGVVATVPKLVEPAINIEGLRFDPILETVKTYVPKVRAAGVDVVVVAMHGGPDTVPSSDPNDAAWQKPIETWGRATVFDTSDAQLFNVAEKVPGIDVVLGGHSHVQVPGVLVNGAIAIEAGHWGKKLGKVELSLRGTAKAFTIDSKKGSLLDPAAAIADAKVTEVSKVAHDATVAWVDGEVGTTVGNFFGGTSGARLVDSALADLINTVQIEVTKKAGYDVDLSASQVLSDSGLPIGTVKRRDVFTIYPYENTLAVVEMTGAVLSEAVAYNGRHIAKVDTAALPATFAELVTVGNSYNYDFFTKLSYGYDVSLPAGPLRVTHLLFEGVSVPDTRTFLVAVNSFRARGNGNPAFAKSTVKWESPKTMREYLVEYIAAHPALSPDAINECNFTTKPDLYTHWFASQPTKCAP